MAEEFKVGDAHRGVPVDALSKEEMMILWLIRNFNQKF